MGRRVWRRGLSDQCGDEESEEREERREVSFERMDCHRPVKDRTVRHDRRRREMRGSIRSRRERGAAEAGGGGGGVAAEGCISIEVRVRTRKRWGEVEEGNALMRERGRLSEEGSGSRRHENGAKKSEATEGGLKLGMSEREVSEERESEREKDQTPVASEHMKGVKTGE